MHPAASVVLVCAWAVAVELAGPALLGLMGLAVLPVLALRASRAVSFKLVRRSRWLLLVLFFTYALSLPGSPLWPPLGAFSPSFAGLEAGALRVARLLLILLGVAVLLAFTSPSRLVYGLYSLARPCSSLGLDARAFAVRLGLTLEAASAAPRGSDWREHLARLGGSRPGEDEAAGAPASYRLDVENWRVRDSLALLGAACGVLIAAV